MHCYLATGGPGAATPTCTLWPPPAPFGYFPARGKYLVQPAGGRNLPQEINSLWKAREQTTFLAFPVSQKISPLRRRPGGFPIAPWTPSGPIPVCMGETSHKRQISCRQAGNGPTFLSPCHKHFCLCRRRPGGFPLAPGHPLWGATFPSTAWRIRNIKTPGPRGQRPPKPGVPFFPKILPFPVNPSPR